MEMETEMGFRKITIYAEKIGILSEMERMNCTPKISIVIPIYNVGAYISDCLASVLMQSYTNYEVICVDDGSTDDSAEITKQFINKAVDNGKWTIENEENITADASHGIPSIRLIRQKNQGLSEARNTGVNTARGEYIMFLDSDDWLENNALERLSIHLKGEDMVCFTGRRYFEDEDKYEAPDQLVAQSYDTGWEYFNQNALLSRRFAFVCVVLRAYRRAFLEENKLHFSSGIYHEDDMFTPYACFYAHKTVVVNESIYVYRIRRGSISYQPKLKNLQDKLWIASKQARFFKQQQVDKSIVYRFITHVYNSVFDSFNKSNYHILHQCIDWMGYYTVSRTKLRHRVYFVAMRVSYRLYLFIRRRFS